MVRRPYSLTVFLLGVAVALPAGALAQSEIKSTHEKFEYMIPMRDGVKLYTAVYVPKRAKGESPIMLERTPYSAGPYGPDNFKTGFRGSSKFVENDYIWAFQDVRGKFMSEGVFENLRPRVIPHWGPNGFQPMPDDIDEGTDTFDTIDYLVKNVRSSNGRVGMWGISYPGGYAALGLMSRHPALKAVSPQAPTSDWFLGDDMHHNGAFFLQDFVSFFSGFGVVRPAPAPQNPPRVPFSVGDDAYKFFLDLGALSNVDPKIYQGRVPYWWDIQRHDTYDEFWQARSVPSGLTDLKAAVLWTGGFFDAEDCWGPLNCYKAAEEKNPGLVNHIVMGPWFHGMWHRADGRTFHDQDWGSNTSQWYQETIEFPFFDSFLRGNGSWKGAEATMFDSGAKEWKTFAKWPPASAKETSLYLAAGSKVSRTKPLPGTENYVSDPSNPVPYEGGQLRGRSRSYMLADQRFAADRDDVLVFRTEPLTTDLTLAGPILPELFVKVSGTDCDFVVKVIDEYPASGDLPGYQMLVRGEVMRAKFRNSFINPSPLDPAKFERVSFSAPDVMHTFKKGHRLMIQVQSSWFPLVDRNPHKFMNIFMAKDGDFASATVELALGGDRASRVVAYQN